MSVRITAFYGRTSFYIDGKASGRLAWKIVDVYLLYNEDGALYEIDAGQHGKPYYVPPKAELLAYDDASYFEPTPQAEQLRSFLSCELQMKREIAEVIFQDIWFHTRSVSGGFQPVVDMIEQAGADLNGKKLGAFAAVYQAFSNHTRMRCNRGHTPVELISMIPPEDRFPQSFSFGSNIRAALTDGMLDAAELQQSILTMELPYEELRSLMLNALTEVTSDIARLQQPPKISRNDLCPRGSGKKYKRCCGKGAFRRFKSGIRYHKLEQRRYGYRDRAYREIAVQWCQDQGLEYTEES